jgi:hypothetical protein
LPGAIVVATAIAVAVVYLYHLIRLIKIGHVI